MAEAEGVYVTRMRDKVLLVGVSLLLYYWTKFYLFQSIIPLEPLNVD
jgi:hypothetical protein